MHKILWTRNLGRTQQEWHISVFQRLESYVQGRGKEVFKWLKIVDISESSQVFFSPHSLSMWLLGFLTAW